jgi:UDPglucose 6-dehydrogenase
LSDLALEINADPYSACTDADVLAVLTEWPEFRTFDFTKVFELMAEPAIVDGRNLLDPLALRRRGFRYEGIGRS